MEIKKIQLFRKQRFGDKEIKITSIINSFLNHSASGIWMYSTYPPHADYSKSHGGFLNTISDKFYLNTEIKYLINNSRWSHFSWKMFLISLLVFLQAVLLRLSESKDKRKRCYLVYLTVPAHRKDCEQHSNWNQRILLLPELSVSHQPGK